MYLIVSHLNMKIQNIYLFYIIKWRLILLIIKKLRVFGQILNN